MYEISKSSAQMLMCYETLDDFLSFDGRGSRSGAWQYDKFMATRKQPNLLYALHRHRRKGQDTILRDRCSYCIEINRLVRNFTVFFIYLL